MLQRGRRGCCPAFVRSLSAKQVADNDLLGGNRFPSASFCPHPHPLRKPPSKSGWQDELLCTYAALVLHDDGAEITPQAMTNLIKVTTRRHGCRATRVSERGCFRGSGFRCGGATCEGFQRTSATGYWEAWCGSEVGCFDVFRWVWCLGRSNLAPKVALLSP